MGTELKPDNKVVELLNTVDDARKSLQNWQEQRTDAMMSLDVIRANVETLQEEKRAIEAHLRSFENESTVRVELLNAELEMVREENLNLQTHIQNLSEQNAILAAELRGQREVVELQKAEYQIELAKIETQSGITLSDERESFLREREDLKTEIMNLTSKLEELQASVSKTEKERDELREVVFEEAIEAVKQNQSVDRRPKFIMDYLKRVGYEVPGQN